MPFTIDGVVPWGRTMAEYEAMFSLTTSDLQGRILGCGDGPASFNAEMTARGYAVVSADPLYTLAADAIRQRGEEAFRAVMAQVRQNQDDFVWTHVPSLPALGRRRMAALDRFLTDYAQGRATGRYVNAALPHLPFPDQVFDLALSSHFLFLYSQAFDLTFHLRAMQEMLRVAPEVRIFPLLQMGGLPSPHVEEVIAAFKHQGIQVDSVPVNYEFQKGGNRMLRLRLLRHAASDPGSRG